MAPCRSGIGIRTKPRSYEEGAVRGPADGLGSVLFGGDHILCKQGNGMGRFRPEAGLSYIVTPDLIRGPFTQRGKNGSRIKFGMTRG